MWTMLLLSGLVSKFTDLKTKPAVGLFSLLALLSLGVLTLIFIGVAIFFRQIQDTTSAECAAVPGCETMTEDRVVAGASRSCSGCGLVKVSLESHCFCGTTQTSVCILNATLNAR